MQTRIIAGLVIVAVALAGVPLASAFGAQLVAPSFTAAQAANGKSVYDVSCASCHGPNLSDGAYGPPLNGDGFLQRWGGKPMDALFLAVTGMPVGAPRSLNDETYADLLAYILQHNGVHAAAEPLPADPQQLSALLLPSIGPNPTGGISSGAKLPPPPNPRPNPLDRVTPVTDAMLADAPSGDWLTWRRTNDSLGYSPLKQIDKSNVGNLRVAWSWALPEGPSQVTPLVHDGVIFVQSFGDVVQALDASSGELLWQYARWLPKNISSMQLGKRGMGIYGTHLYVATSDAHVIALDVKTGAVAWDTVVGDLAAGFNMTGGVLLARGKVMVGTSGQAPGGNYIVALDAETGKEAWRFHTIARPGEPGGDSWNGLPLDQRNGGSVWVPGSYDAKLGLAFFGVAQTYDTGPLQHPVGEPGVVNAALYTDSTLALDPDTGELKWYFQHFPNDQWDLDWAFERHLLKLPVAGQEQTVLVTGGKIGIYDMLEAGNGSYLASIDLGLQDIVTGIDPETGEKHINPAALPSRDKIVSVCPHADGTKNWLPSAYNPETHMLFVPLMEICMDLVPVPEGEAGMLSSGVRWAGRPRADGDGLYGRLQAVNLETRKLGWAQRQRAPRSSGLLVTAGGLLFGGDLDRYFTAYDQDNGRQLWQARLNDVSNAAPISFSVNGRQYVAVTVGHGVLSMARRALVPEIRFPSSPAATLWVFEVPGG